jgi:hypothetical protein
VTRSLLTPPLPAVEKLAIRDRMTLAIIGAPDHVGDRLAPPPEDVTSRHDLHRISSVRVEPLRLTPDPRRHRTAQLGPMLRGAVSRSRQMPRWVVMRPSFSA